MATLLFLQVCSVVRNKFSLLINMLPRFSLLFTILAALVSSAFAQDGKLSGKVLGEESQPLEFVRVLVFDGDEYRYGTQTAADGTFSIQPVAPGTYRVEAQYLSQKKVLDEVSVIANQTRNITIAFEATTLDVVEIFEESPFETSPIVGTTMTSDEIVNAGTRSVNSLAAISAGVYQGDEGGALSVRGARTSATVYYVDGVKVRGSSSLPQQSIAQLQVITGGTPAEFGDFTGGVINITTANPAPKFSGVGELVTSQFLDPYGYNIGALTLTGPLITRERSVPGSDRTFKTSVLSFFVNGEVSYVDDSSPAITGVYGLRDGLLDSLQADPMTISENGFTFLGKANYITRDDVVELNTKPFNNGLSGRALFRLDFQPVDNILVKVGGNINYSEGTSWGTSTSLFSPQNDDRTERRTYRLWGRFQQSFPGTENSAIRNLFYTIQADFSGYDGRNFNARHEDNFFDYGYIGRFYYDVEPVFQYINDPTDEISSSPHWRSVGVPTFGNLVFDPSDSRNPLLSNYNTSILNYVEDNGVPNLFFNPNVTDPTIFQLQSLNDLSFRQGILNGGGPRSIYSIYSGVGSTTRSYLQFAFEQFRLTGQATAEIRGHNLKAGFEFEQRSERLWSIGAAGLWPLMRQYTNFHLQTREDDPANYILQLNSAGEWNDTVIVPLQYSEADQFSFDQKLREKLGLAVDGTDWVNIDAYGPENYSLDMFTADELLSNGLTGVVSYYGFDYLGNRVDPVPEGDFFTNSAQRPINAFRPTYISAFLQDRFEFEDIVFNIGVRVDRFDANQSVLKDNYSLFPTYSAGELSSGIGGVEAFSLPAGIGEDYVPYVDDPLNFTEIVGYRDGEIWYDASGAPASSARIAQLSGGRPSPALVEDTISMASFEDYTPQTVVMPRLSFSFPINDQAQFFAHYDVLSQRPGQLGAGSSSLLAAQISDYVFLANRPTSEVANPNLRPEITIDYEAGFKQRLGQRLGLTISAFYREMRNMIRFRRFVNAYPFSYDTYDNLDFGTVKGFLFALDLVRTNNLSFRASYQLQFSDATGGSISDARGIVNYLEGAGILRTLLPNPNDQRHRFSGNIDYRFVQSPGPSLNLGDNTIYPFKNLGANLTFYLGSGWPYTQTATPVPTVQGGIPVVTQIQGSPRGARLPWQYRLDFRMDKRFGLGGKIKDDGSRSRGYNMQVYLNVQNLLNTQNILGVYGYTGLPTDDGYLSSDIGQQAILGTINPQSFVDLYTIALNGPGGFSLPRRTRLGIMFEF